MPESVRELAKEQATTLAMKASEPTSPPKVETPVAEPIAESPKLLLTPTVRIGEQSFKGKAHPLAIGEASKKLSAHAPIEELFKPESQGFTAIDPATGTERFVSRKEAADIFEKQTGRKPTKPDSLTSEDLRDAGLLGHLDEAAATVPEAKTGAQAAKPEVVRQGNSRFKNPIGDPLGTTYRATEADWSNWQEVKANLEKAIAEGKDADSPEMMVLRQENETIKNKYGGMPPEPPATKGGEPVETQIQKGPQEVLDQGKAVAEPALGEATAVPLPADLPALAQLRVTKPELRPQIDAKIAELRDRSCPCCSPRVKQLPPVPAGHVRLFHGGGPRRWHRRSVLHVEHRQGINLRSRMSVGGFYPLRRRRRHCEGQGERVCRGRQLHP
jgi:hypothetical protein